MEQIPSSAFQMPFDRAKTMTSRKKRLERSDDNNNCWCVMGGAGGRRIGQCGCRKLQEVQRSSCGRTSYNSGDNYLSSTY